MKIARKEDGFARLRAKPRPGKQSTGLFAWTGLSNPPSEYPYAEKDQSKRIGLFVAIADKIDAVDFGIKIRKLEKMLCCNNFSHFDAWIFLIFIIGQNRCIHLNFCSGNELEDFKKDFDPSNIGILQYTPLAHAHKTIHRSQKC